ncbi:uncharacterized protein [Antedon mediterranea]|uniref:uncharacterized protein isoform X2 n=1 Tax=Antedon mediterranea TaxID=105859 RepID=UPI003AF52DD3
MDNELTCPCCFEFYDDPVLLPCAHSFCRKCLRSIFNALQERQNKANGSRKGVKISKVLGIPCPSCRKTIELCDGDIDTMQSNFLLSNIVKRYKESTCSIIEALLFDVKRTTLNNNGYVNVPSTEFSKTTDKIPINDEVVYESPYMVMVGHQQPVQKPPKEEDYACMESVRPRTRPDTLPKNTKSRITSVYETPTCSISPETCPTVVTTWRPKEQTRRKSVGMLAAEVANQASNRSTQNRTARSPIRGGRVDDWRSAAIRRKSSCLDQADLPPAPPPPPPAVDGILPTCPIRQASGDDVRTGIAALLPNLAEEAAAKINRRKMSAPAVRPKPNKNALARRSRTLDNTSDYTLQDGKY